MIPKIRKLQKMNGFTLVETIIYIALVGGVVGSFISFNITVSNARNKNMAMNVVQSGAANAIQIMTAKIKSAQTVLDPPQGSSSPRILFRLSSGADAEFKIENNILYFTEGVGETTAITSNQISVDNIQFTNMGYFSNRDNVKLDMELSYRNVGSTDYLYSQNYETDIDLRNRAY